MDANTLPTESHSFIQVIRLLYSKGTFRYLSLATALLVFCIYGLSNWAPSFLSRVHGMSKSEIGIALGLIVGIGGAVGTISGGFLTDHFAKRDKRWYLKIPAYAVVISIPFLAGALFLQDSIYSLICLGVTNALYSMYLGPAITVVHSLVPASMRALSSAVLFLVLNLIGLGFGPLTIGMVSDVLSPSLGNESLRFAMSLMLIVSAVAVVLFFRSAGKMVSDLKLS